MKLLNDDEGIQEEDGDTKLGEFSHPVPWQKIEAEGLDCDYALIFSKKEADELFKHLEEEVVYSTGIPSIFFLLRTQRLHWIWSMLVFQEKKQRSRCMERSTTSQESRQRMETRV